MTATAVPAPPDEGGVRLRPVPWRRMAGVTWRQHRVALAGVTVLLGALTVWLWTTGTPLHHAYIAAAGCHPASSAECQNLADTFSSSVTSQFMSGKGPGGILLQLLAPLIGAFVGAPVLARELETGTFRYAWTQAFGRWRWALAKLVLLAAAVTVLTAAFGFLVSWYFQPYSGSLFQSTPFGNLFTLRQVAFPAWTLAAFAIGALAGMLIRRVVPAIVTTLAVYAGLAFVAAAFLREHYLAPLATTALDLPGTSTAWIIGTWWTKGGRFAFAGSPPIAVLDQFCSSGPGPGSKDNGPSFAPCLAPHGYTQWTSYQPASRFWPFQWIEGGWLLVLSAVLVAATVWLVHRRAA